MAELRLANARKVYPGGVEAVKGIDLAVADGEFIALVGPSGCGKSTLLRMIAGLEQITAGEVHIAGRLVNDLEPAERDIAMVFQNYALYPHMNVFDNMAYGLRNRRTPKAEIETRVLEAAKLLEIEELMARRPRELSGGQRQRVAMGRAIVRKPAAFLFDEPLSNLDAKLRVQMRVEIRKLQRQLATTSVYVTHDQVEAMTMADRIVVMNAGAAEQIGTPREVYQKPATTFVAGFIGSPPMNLLRGRMTDSPGRVRIGEATIAVPAVDGARQGDEVIVGIRPENLAPSSDGEGLPVVVELAEHLGMDTNVYGRITGLDAGLIAFREAADGLHAPGDVVRISAPLSVIHLFDVGSGRRLVGPG